MPVVQIGSQHYTVVTHEDAPNESGACHQYLVSAVEHAPDAPAEPFAWVRCQDGPILESGINGCFNEDLLAIVIHRLQGFQSGLYACEENTDALLALYAAMQALNRRTATRHARGVLGTHTA